MHSKLKIIILSCLFIFGTFGIAGASSSDTNINYSRLQNCMERAANGEELNIAFFGSSITQSSLANSDKLTYAYHVWQKTFLKQSLIISNN